VRARRLRSVALGSAGARLALALGAVSALTVFIATAGPRELAAGQDQAIRTATASLSAADTAAVASGAWFSSPSQPGSTLTAGQQTSLTRRLTAVLPAPIRTSLTADRGFVAGIVHLLTAAPSAMFGPNPPVVEVTEDSGLAADVRLVTGAMPTRALPGVPGTSAADRAGVTLQVAVTPATAARFSLRVGSTLQSGPIRGRLVALRVTGIVRAPADGLLGESGLAQLNPAYTCLDCAGQAWLGGALLGPSELQAMQTALAGVELHGAWYLPVSLRHLTAAGLGPLASALNAYIASGDYPSFLLDGSLSSQLPAELSGIQAQLAATGSIYDLVVGGTFAAELLLMLLCAGLAADRYEPELALIRARGGSMRQVTLRALRRSACATVPGVAIGLTAAVAGVGTSGATLAAAVLPALTVLIALAAPPARCAWRLRSVTARAARPADLETRQRSPRRVVTEATVVALAAGAVVALRVRGLGSGTDQLALAAPFLIAAAASIAIGRLYPIPVRALLPLARGRRGPVGFLGLTKAGRSGLATLLPALALVLTLTLAAFGWMLTQSVAAGQVASSWGQTGADAVITAPGDDTISAGTAHALARVPGVRHIALIYTSPADATYSPDLISPAGKLVPVGLAVVSPGQYAALARDTPWPAFPAAALARRPGPVPILVSAAAASEPGVAAATGTRQVLDQDGIRLPVVVAGSIADTPAFPAGGVYVVMPQWAVGQFPSIAGPATLLVTTRAAATAPLAAATTADLHGDSVLLRAQVLKALRGSAAQQAVRLVAFGTWTAVALSAVALLFGLAATAPGRRTMRTRLAALGMSGRQAGALALLDPLSLLIVGIAGMAVSGVVLALVSGQVISLAPLTGPLVPAQVILDAPALVLPALGAIALALTAAATEHWLSRRADNATALRTEEAR
jgi:putative ABC transport system permease protein